MVPPSAPLIRAATDEINEAKVKAILKAIRVVAINLITRYYYYYSTTTTAPCRGNGHFYPMRSSGRAWWRTMNAWSTLIGTPGRTVTPTTQQPANCSLALTIPTGRKTGCDLSRVLNPWDDATAWRRLPMR
jgi:hypothetical protein